MTGEGPDAVGWAGDGADHDELALVDAWLSAFNCRDADALIALCAADVEHEPSVLARGGGVYHGHAGLREWVADVEARQLGYTASLLEVRRAADGDILVFGTLDIDEEAVTPYALRLSVRDGKVVRTRTVLSDRRTLDALGLIDIADA